MSNFVKKIDGWLYDLSWFVAIRSHKPLSECDAGADFHVLKNSIRYWCADPFTFEKDGVTYLFMEIYDIITQKGAIGYRTVKNGRVSRIHKCLSTEYHLSYPYVFEENGSVYMIPECHKSGAVTRYKAESFPNRWVEDEILFSEVVFCDTNYFSVGDRAYILTMPLENGKYEYDKLFMYYRDSEEWRPCQDNPVVSDASRARNAGRLIFENETVIRPSQNCENSYGENIVFNVIDCISKWEYKEHPFFSLKAASVETDNGKSYNGIHTYNSSSLYDVIDLRVDRCFQPVRLLYLFLNKLGRLK